MKYVKRPIEIEAVEVTGLSIKAVEPVLMFCGENAEYSVGSKGRRASLMIKTLEGPLLAKKGDMIIKGVQGEFYPCKRDIFEQTYDLVEEISEDTFPSPGGESEPRRFRLPAERFGPTVKFTLSEDGVDAKGKPIVVQVDGYFTVNMYADGRPSELWITLDKPGYPIQGFANCWAIAMSMLLQYGVPPQKLYDKFKTREFQPNGISQVEGVPIAKSLVDLIVRWMERNCAPTAQISSKDDRDWMNAVEDVVK